MNWSKIISWILILLLIIFLVYIFFIDNTENKDITKDITKDINTSVDLNIKDKSSGIYNDLKDRVSYGKKDRNIEIKNYFCPEDNCELYLNNLIENSKDKINCSIYDIKLSGITNSLISAKERGISINILTDQGRAKDTFSKVGILKENDISVIYDDLDNSYMHNKYCVFDDEILWIGSANFTLNGFYKNNNNVLVIKDKELASVFSNKVIEHMNTDFYNQDKDIETNEISNIEYYFCLEDDCSYQVLKHLNDLNKSIDCMYFSYTYDDFTDMLIDKDIDSRFIFEKRNIDKYSEYNRLKDLGYDVLFDDNIYSMHNKFCILDNKEVMMGSANLSNNGLHKNNETIIFLENQNIVQNYKDYFNKYYDLYKENT